MMVINIIITIIIAIIIIIILSLLLLSLAQIHFDSSAASRKHVNYYYYC